jgi:BolA family transcriptional regulator, general stress-responsive regulator
MQINSVDFIRTQLTEKLLPTHLEIIDDGALHAGHIGAQGGGHYTVIIAAPSFINRGTLQCHRLVYEALGDVIGKEIHALSIQILKEKDGLGKS